MIFRYDKRLRHSRDSIGTFTGLRRCRRMCCACDGEDTCGHGHILTYYVQHKCKFTQLNKFEQIYIQSEHNMLSVIR